MVHRPADIEARARHWIRSAQSLSTVTKQRFLAKNIWFSICSFFYLGFEIGHLENTGSRNRRKWVILVGPHFGHFGGWWWTSEIENYSKAGACGKAFELFSCSKQLRNKRFSRRKFVALIVQNWKIGFCISAFENFRSRPGRICLLFGHNLSEMLIFKPRYHK